LKNHSLNEDSSFYIRIEKPIRRCNEKEKDYYLNKYTNGKILGKLREALDI
jgi:hypothetical protein